MNGYLLDTHVILWWLDDPTQLSDQARQAIEDPDNLIYVSAAAAWEMGLKKSLGRLDIPGNLPQVLQSDSIQILDITIHHALAVADLPMLSMVGRPVAVNPDASLLATARSHGWPVLSIRATRTPLRVLARTALDVGKGITRRVFADVVDPGPSTLDRLSEAGHRVRDFASGFAAAARRRVEEGAE